MSSGHTANKWWNWDSNPGSQLLGCALKYPLLCQTRPWSDRAVTGLELVPQGLVQPHSHQILPAWEGGEHNHQFHLAQRWDSQRPLASRGKPGSTRALSPGSWDFRFQVSVAWEGVTVLSTPCPSSLFRWISETPVT